MKEELPNVPVQVIQDRDSRADISFVPKTIKESAVLKNQHLILNIDSASLTLSFALCLLLLRFTQPLKQSSSYTEPSQSCIVFTSNGQTCSRGFTKRPSRHACRGSSKRAEYAGIASTFQKVHKVLHQHRYASAVQ